jgi:hypothetical protein
MGDRSRRTGHDAAAPAAYRRYTASYAAGGRGHRIRNGTDTPAEFRAIGQIRRLELLWALTATVGMVLLGTLRGILVALCLAPKGSHIKNPTPVLCR